MSLGVGGEFSGYRLRFRSSSKYENNDTVYWEVYIHRDLGWASMHLRNSYTKVTVKPGTYNRVILSARDIHQLDTQTYPCESRDGYSRDEVSYRLHHMIWTIK